MTLTELKALNGDNKMVSIICPTPGLADKLFGIFVLSAIETIRWGGNGLPVTLNDTKWDKVREDTVYHLHFTNTGCKLYYGTGILTEGNFSIEKYGHPKLIAIHARAIIDAYSHQLL